MYNIILKEFEFITNTINTAVNDLKFYNGGYQKCNPNHSWGYGIRNNYLIHYIFEGKGTFEINNNEYKLNKYNGFIIPPNTITRYIADSKEPWFYFWIEMSGTSVHSLMGKTDFNKNNPIFFDDSLNFYKDCLSDMINSNNLDKGRELFLNSLAYKFISRLTEFSSKNTKFSNITIQEQYVIDAANIIKSSFPYSISIHDIAKSIGIDRKYLAFLSKKFLNTSLQQLLIDCRIEKACELLKNFNLSIGEVSSSAGYQDQLVFSRVFKKRKGISPSNYRKSLTQP